MNTDATPARNYYLVFAALMALTLLTIGIATIDLGAINTIVALLIAAVKAALVIAIFMHVDRSGPLIRLVVFAGVLWLAILIVLTLSDFVSRTWVPEAQGL